MLSGRLAVGNGLQKTFWATFVLMLGMGFSLVGAAKTGQAQEYEFNIPRQNVGAALNELARQAGALPLLFPFDAVQSVSSNPVVGIYTVSNALEILLQDTGLTGGLTEGGVITISQLASKDEGNGMNENEVVKTRDNKLSTFFLTLFGALGAGNTMGQDVSSRSADELGYLEEIIVTANKREQDIQSIAMSITALGNEEIGRRGLVSMEDYLSTIPGVTQQDFGVGQHQIVMRGIASSEREQATVAVYFGEVPLTSPGLGFSVDPKLVDMERIEVLRGPQGTLYGSGSMSGTVRNIPVSPQLQELSGSIDVGYSNTADSGGDNNKIEGIFNLPLIEDELALRVVAYRHDNSGYIENVAADDPVFSATAAAFGATARSEDDIGNSEFEGLRTSLLWAPTENLEMTLMYMQQDLEQLDGRLVSTPALGDYSDAIYDLPGVGNGREYLTDNVDIANLVIEYDLGWSRILSSTSWYEGTNDEGFFGGRASLLPIGIDTNADKEALVQEVRLTTYWDMPVQFTGGVYFEDLDRTLDTEWFWGGDPAILPAIVGGVFEDIFVSETDFRIEQLAVFGELSYDLSEQIELTFGVRWFDYEREDIASVTGAPAVTGSLEDLFQESEIGEDDQSFKVNGIYTPNEDTLIYLQWAEGFRLGRPVLIEPPATFCDTDGDDLLDGTNVRIDSPGPDSDFLDSYELGGKFALMDDRLTISAAVYRIDWDGIPVQVFSENPGQCFFTVEVNAGEARSEGIEFEAAYYVNPNLLLNFGASYVDAELTEDTLLGEEGTRLPNSPRANANISVDYLFDIAGYNSFVRANFAYVGGFYRDIEQNGPEGGDYGDLDMRAGISFDNFSVELFGTNLLNSDEITYPSFAVQGVFRQRPRTIGFDVGYQF